MPLSVKPLSTNNKNIIDIKAKIKTLNASGSISNGIWAIFTGLGVFLFIGYLICFCVCIFGFGVILLPDDDTD